MTGSVLLSWGRKNLVRLILFATAVIAFVLGYVSIGLLFIFLFGWSLIRRYQRDFYVLQYIFFQRYSLFVGFLLLAFPIFASMALPEVLGPLFHVDFYPMIGITLLSILAAWTIMFTSGLLYLAIAIRNELPFYESHARGSKNELPTWFQRHRFFWFAWLAAPTIITLNLYSELGIVETLLAQSIGIALAGGIRFAIHPIARSVTRFFSLLVASAFWRGLLNAVGRLGQLAILRALMRFGFLIAVDSFAKSIKQSFKGLEHDSYIIGSSVGKAKEFDFSPVRGFSFFFLTLVLYFVGYWLFEPPSRLGTDNEPAYAYLLVIFMLWCWILNFLALYLDKYRVPVTIVLIAFVFGLYQISSVDHYYEVTAATKDRLPQSLGPQESLDAWLAKHPYDTHPTVVLVAAMGGGIRAAYWTNIVLDELTQELGATFAESIVLMSTVSGGAVGAVYSIDAYPLSSEETCGKIPNDLFAKALHQSGQESLHALAWGMAYPDFFRKVLPFLPRNKLVDRGWALEKEWTDTLGHSPTLTDWQVGTNRGCRPAIVFNTTVVETGDRFLIGSIKIPEPPHDYMPTEHRQAENFLSEFEGCDIAVFTAARLSATSPYVTSQATDMPTDPNCSPGGEKNWGYHLADGGYYDNYGVVTILEYLIDVLSADSAIDLSNRNILILQIRASEVDEPGEKGEGQGFTFSTVGPILALLNVRSSTQIARNDLDIGLLKKVFDVTAIDAVEFELGNVGPLSWDLTATQKDQIRQQWLKDKNVSALRKVAALFPNVPSE